MYSDSDTACAVGCPIRRSRDQRLLASPPGLSQRATSFIASQCQGIHQMPFISRLSTTPNGKYQTALLQLLPAEDAANFSLEDTCRTRSSYPSSKPRGPVDRYTGRVHLGHVTLASSPIQSTNRSRGAVRQRLRIGTSCRVTWKRIMSARPSPPRGWWR
jgi:hypothetical protein